MVRLSVTLGAFAGLRTLGGLGSLGLQVTAAKGSVGGDYKECGKCQSVKLHIWCFCGNYELMKETDDTQ